MHPGCVGGERAENSGERGELECGYSKALCHLPRCVQEEPKYLTAGDEPSYSIAFVAVGNDFWLHHSIINPYVTLVN